MNEAKKAAFSFKGYQIKKFAFEEPLDLEANNFSIGFNPSGSYNTSNGLFTLKIEFRSFYTDKNEKETDVITALVSADFHFSDNLPLEELPTYFYRNSVAIVFPYLRAFVSTLTLQANIRPLILPIMNLTDLEIPLKQNTTLFNN